MSGYATCPVCHNTFYRDEDWKTLCLDCWKESRGLPNHRSRQSYVDPNPLAVVVDDTMLRRLIHLCHPDKHGNSDAAKEVTQWLLEIRAYRKH